MPSYLANKLLIIYKKTWTFRLPKEENSDNIKYFYIINLSSNNPDTSIPEEHQGNQDGRALKVTIQYELLILAEPKKPLFPFLTW